MVGKEGEHVGKVLVGKILRQNRVDAGHPLIPVYLVFLQGPNHGALQREVHDGRQIGIETVPVGIVLLPVGHLRDVHVPALAHYVHPGILVRHGPAPPAHGLRLVVRIGIYPEAVQSGVFCPPDGPLLEILENEGIVQVHVRHGRDKPAALLTLQVPLRGVRVHVHGEERVHLHVGFVHMVPVLERRVFHPPVGGAAVVGDHVHNHLQTAFVRLLNKGFVQGIVSKAGVDMIIVRAGIAVVGLPGLVVQQQRRTPDGRGAQVFDIIQVVHHALQVAAVTGHGIGPVHPVRQLGHRPGYQGAVFIGLFRHRGAGETVRHNQVNHIGRGEAFPPGAPLLPGLNQVGIADGLPLAGKEEIIGSRPGRFRNLHVHEEEVGVVGLMHLLDAETLSGDRDLTGRNIRALHHQLQAGFHARPPAQGFHPANFLRGGVGVIGIDRSLSASGGTKHSSHQKCFFHQHTKL